MTDPIDALVFYAVFVFAVTIHEAAHATAALLGGDLTAYEGGQVSIDPLPHMRREPFGMVILPLLTVFLSGWPWGYASAPFDPAWAQRYPRRAAWMALAGPGANLALVVLIAAGVKLGLALGHFEVPMSIGFGQITASAGDPSGLAAGVAYVLSIAFSLNLLLFVLNMLPLPPLDGSTALMLVVPDSLQDGYRALIQQPFFAIAGLILVFTLIGDIFFPVLYAAIGLLYPGVSYG